MVVRYLVGLSYLLTAQGNYSFASASGGTPPPSAIYDDGSALLADPSDVVLVPKDPKNQDLGYNKVPVYHNSSCPPPKYQPPSVPNDKGILIRPPLTYAPGDPCLNSNYEPFREVVINRLKFNPNKTAAQFYDFERITRETFQDAELAVEKEYRRREERLEQQEKDRLERLAAQQVEQDKKNGISPKPANLIVIPRSNISRPVDSRTGFNKYGKDVSILLAGFDPYIQGRPYDGKENVNRGLLIASFAAKYLKNWLGPQATIKVCKMPIQIDRSTLTLADCYSAMEKPPQFVIAFGEAQPSQISSQVDGLIRMDLNSKNNAEAVRDGWAQNRKGVWRDVEEMTTFSMPLAHMYCANSPQDRAKQIALWRDPDNFVCNSVSHQFQDVLKKSGLTKNSLYQFIHVNGHATFEKSMKAGEMVGNMILAAINAKMLNQIKQVNLASASGVKAAFRNTYPTFNFPRPEISYEFEEIDNPAFLNGNTNTCEKLEKQIHKERTGKYSKTSDYNFLLKTKDANIFYDSQKKSFRYQTAFGEMIEDSAYSSYNSLAKIQLYPTSGDNLRKLVEQGYSIPLEWSAEADCHRDFYKRVLADVYKDSETQFSSSSVPPLANPPPFKNENQYQCAPKRLPPVKPQQNLPWSNPKWSPGTLASGNQDSVTLDLGKKIYLNQYEK
jgi:hypothetical protein